jgi:hypothetical protein
LGTQKNRPLLVAFTEKFNSRLYHFYQKKWYAFLEFVIIRVLDRDIIRVLDRDIIRVLDRLSG